MDQQNVTQTRSRPTQRGRLGFDRDAKVSQWGSRILRVNGEEETGSMPERARGP